MFSFSYAMGCIFEKFRSHHSEEQLSSEPAKQYSWDVRAKINPKDFTVENLTDDSVYRLPGAVNGQQFIIQNCKNCRIFILDHVATITVDDCVNCQIVVGPVKSSIFVRDCADCKLVTACQQFRSRDCSRMDISLYCVTQPIIESSTSMRFSCFQYHYPQLQDQFRQAGLSVFNNDWSHIHDFTPVVNEHNFSLLPMDAQVTELIPVPDSTCSVPITVDRLTSVVPPTLGQRRKTSNESCFVVFFHDDQSTTRALNLIKNMLSSHGRECVLVQTKEVKMAAADAERVFTAGSYSEALLQRGPVIGLEFCGEAACRLCHEALTDVIRDHPGLVYISPDSSTASKQIESFYSVAEMMMAI